MSGPTTTTHDSLVDIWNVKIGRTDAYASGNASAGGLEQKILKAVLGEGATATSIDDFKVLASDLSGNTGTHKTANISGSDLQVTQHFPYRNAVVLADYLQNNDASANDISIRGEVAIKSGVTQSAQSKILPNSSAFENASVRFQVSDPYDPTGDTIAFYAPDISGNFYGYFGNDVNNYRFTRNVNANCANTDGTASISVTEHTEWNTGNYGVVGAGPAFVNGSVSLNGEGAPVATLYGNTVTDNSNNILSSVYNSSGGSGNQKGFEISYVAGQPEVGRYALSWSAGSSGDNANPITIETNRMTDLVVVANIDDYTTFLSNTTTPVTLAQLPTDLTATSVVGYLTENVSASLNPGFNFVISATGENDVTGQVLVTTTHGISSPIEIDASQMDFDLKNKYYLEKSVPSTVLPTDSSSNLLETTIVGTGAASVPVTNSLTITNGSLLLTGTDAAQFDIVDGTESLNSTQILTNGAINIYNSVPMSAYNTPESAKPRATGGSAILANNCVVNYSAGEDDYIADVGVLAESDKTVDNLEYDLTTLVSQTSETGPTVSNKIGYLNGAVALVSQTNASITPSAITFSANINAASYNNDEVQVIDLVCQRKWQEGTAYKSDNSEITGVAVNIVGSNVTDAAGLKDLRVKLDAKVLADLSFESTIAGSNGWAITVNDGSAFLKTSLLKQGVLDDSDIIDILTASEPTPALMVSFGPAVNTVNANKYTKFHNQLTVAYGEAEQITYDDEFTISNYSVSASETVEDVTASHLYIPANTKLTMRSFTETFKVTTPFRFGNYSNISITTPTITQTTTYYALTDNINADKVLPRSYLAPIRTLDGGLVPQATISEAVTSLTVDFTQADLKPFKSQLQQQVGGSDTWVNVTSGDAHVDLWYNTNTYLDSNVGDFEYAFSFSPAVNTMAEQTFYIDMSLEKGAASFSITGKTFTPAQVDALGSSFNIQTFMLEDAVGTAITGMTASYYTPDDSTPGASGTTTLSGGGYTFTYTNNMYVNIRIIACPHGMFKVVRSAEQVADAATYTSIAGVDGSDYVKLGQGIYVFGGLKNAIGVSAAIRWTLRRDAIQVQYWGGYTANYVRIPELENEYRPDKLKADGVTYWTGLRGVKNLIVRGFTPNSTVTIERTPSTFDFDIAGYHYDGNLHNAISYQDAIIGNLSLSSAVDAITMYSTGFGTKTFPLSIKYGSYTIYDRPASNELEATTITVAAYKTVISNRKGVRIISKSLSTKTGAEYSILYTVSDTLNVYRINNYTSTSTTYSDFTGTAGVNTNAFSMSDLKLSTADNRIGNVLKIKYLGNGDIPDLKCYFTIAPAFLKFQAVDHTTITASSLPFTKVGTHLLTRYRAVNHATATTVRQAWNPFSGSNVNNMTISATARSYEDYRGTAKNTVGMFNVGPNNLKIQYATGIGGDIASAYLSPAVYDGPIPLNSSSDTNQVSFVSHFASTGGKNEISLNQSEISTSSMPVIFDESDKFNLLVELGSHLLTPKTFTLEFNAGDCTGLTTYCIDSMVKNGANLDVKIAKYTNGTGINSNLFNNNVSNGIAVGGSTKETKIFSTTMTSNMANMLATIKETIPSSVTGWATVGSAGSNSDNVLWLKPTSDTGKTALRTALLLNTNIPRSISVFELDDAVRIMDNQGVAVYRVASQGVVYANTLADHVLDNLASHVNAHLLV